MGLNDKIRQLSKEVIVAYVLFIKKKIDEKDEKYLKLKIDDEFEAYKFVFLEVLRKALKSKRLKITRVPRKVLDECVGVVDLKLSELDMCEFAVDYNDVIIDTCDAIFKKVEEGMVQDGYL